MKRVRYRVSMGTCPECREEMKQLGWRISDDGLRTIFYYKCPFCEMMVSYTHPKPKRPS